VNRQSRKLSMVPAASSPSAARSRAPGTWSSSRLRLHHRLDPVGLERGAEIGSTAVLPDDGVVERCAGRAVPQDDGFALVGDADRGHVIADRLARDGKRRRPDFLCVVLDPTVGGVMLREFALCGLEDVQVRTEADCARRRRTLVDREQLFGHFSFFLSPRTLRRQGFVVVGEALHAFLEGRHSKVD
jgi:hypothetical protein